VSLSTATTDQLDTLPGVGPVLAQHIIDYRTQHGGFRSVDELREVNGIGDPIGEQQPSEILLAI
ncbi:ComEA family DNA-binding protein, partial [Streptomyces anthocyanicus]|uniref:ComEA family DNA-binding protein n=1 Tax=Streptomyces anthocyanicus TaxID=68174 RepID=UPI00363CECC9